MPSWWDFFITGCAKAGFHITWLSERESGSTRLNLLTDLCERLSGETSNIGRETNQAAVESAKKLWEDVIEEARGAQGVTEEHASLV